MAKLHPLLVLLLLLASACAQNVTTSAGIADVPLGTKRTDGVSIVVCIVLLLIGLTYCFFGFRLFKVTLFITGFAIFATIVYVALENANAFSDHENAQAYRLGVSLLAGLAGGVLVICCWGLGVTLIGIVLGLAIANLLFSIVYISKGWIKIVIQIVLAILGAIVVNKFERPIIIIGTSLEGAHLAVLGVDVVANVGISNPDSLSNGIPNDVIYEFVAIVVLACLGMAFQFSTHHGKFGHTPKKQVGSMPPGHKV